MEKEMLDTLKKISKSLESIDKKLDTVIENNKNGISEILEKLNIIERIR